MNLTWKQFENLCVYRMTKEQQHCRGWMKRAGVTGAQLIGRGELNKDRVDYEGESEGVAFKMEVKTCCTASFNLHEVFFKRGQYDELVSFNGPAFLLIHFNPRQLAQVRTLAETVAFPVYSSHEFWQGYESGKTKSISRANCVKYAVFVSWNASHNCRKLSPDIVRAVKDVGRTKNLGLSQVEEIESLGGPTRRAGRARPGIWRSEIILSGLRSENTGEL